MEIKRLQGSDYALLASAVQSLIPEEERDGGVASDSHLMRALEDTACYFIVCVIDSILSGLIPPIQASPTDFRFNRALHRNDHLNEIELLLQLAAGICNRTGRRVSSRGSNSKCQTAV